MVSFVIMFICNLLIPLTMLLAGCWMLKCPPKEINGLIGYRTGMSQKNKDTWAFAHQVCGRLWTRVGAVLLLATILVQLPFARSGEDAMGVVTMILEAVQLVVLLGSILPVELALKRTFDKNGNRR